MENQSTKIPRLREARYARNQTTCIDLKPVRMSFQYEQQQIKRTFSLTELPPYNPLTPEQFTVNYKNYPQKFCKKSCIICSMRKPQPKIKDNRSEDTKTELASTCTQTTPPNPPPQRWNAQTQTIDDQWMPAKLTQRHTQTDKVDGHVSFSSLLVSWGAWISFFIAILAVIVIFSIRYMDVLKWVTRKQLRQPRTLLEKSISYFHRDKILNDFTESSVGQANMPGVLLLFLSYVLILVLNVDRAL